MFFIMLAFYIQEPFGVESVEYKKNLLTTLVGQHTRIKSFLGKIYYISIRIT